MLNWLDPWVLAAATSQFLLVILGVTVSLQDDWAKKHRVLIIGLFALLGLVGLSTSAKSARDAAIANSSLSESLNDLKKSSEDIVRLQGLNTKLQEQLLESNTIISGLAKQNIATVTGGDSFAYAWIQDRFPYFGVVAQGKYPLYDLRARVVDLDEAKKQSHAFLGTTISFGEIVPGMSKSQNIKFEFGNSESRSFNIFFTARNGSWIQLLRLRRLRDGRWVSATRVDRDGEKLKRPAYEKIDKDFPRNENGGIEWER